MSAVPSRQWSFGVLLLCAVAAAQAAPPRAPELTQTDPANWLNSKPLQLQQLRGKPTLLEFWTQGCTACRRTIPWVQAVEKRFADDLQVLGIHTPEFSYERPRALVERKLRDFEIRHPVMLDNDFSYWNAIGNRHWPAFYLLDHQGYIRGVWVGEILAGSPRAEKIEERLAAAVRASRIANP